MSDNVLQRCAFADDGDVGEPQRRAIRDSPWVSLHMEVKPALDGAAPPLVLENECEQSVAIPVGGRPTVMVFYRGDFCPYCNGQLAVYARNFEVFEAAGAVVYGISVDPPHRNAAMITKLMLPFSLLSDPAGSASRSYGVWNADQGEAHPAIFITDSSGVLRYVYRGADFTDRPGDEEVKEVLAAIDSHRPDLAEVLTRDV